MTKKVQPLLLLLFGTGCLLCLQGFWIPIKAQVAQLLLQQAWQQTQHKHTPVKPWPWADTWPVARLRASKYGQDLIVLHGQQGQSLAFGPGMLARGADPGSPGTCVLAGHRDTSFRFLEQVKKGDIFTIEIPDGRIWSYRVFRTSVEPAKNLYFNRAKGANLALVTCYPFHALRPGTPQRYVVLAERILPLKS